MHAILALGVDNSHCADMALVGCHSDLRSKGGLLLGHESIDQTSRYIDVSLADMARAMATVI